MVVISSVSGRRARVVKAALAGVALSVLATSAHAATFIFPGGLYQPGTTAPEPLTVPDLLEISGPATKTFSAVSFTNQSGTVNWLGGAISLQNAAQIDNQSLWDAQTDNQVFYGGGALPTFDNSGIFRKSAGAGATTIGGFTFTNSGVIDALTGTINFSGTTVTFNDGTEFTGAGATAINSNGATFAGGFTSENLTLASGTFTGVGAVLDGAVDYSGGIVTGGWTVASAAELTVLGPATKTLSAADITNEGTITWTGGAVSFQNATALTNDGLIDAQTDNQLFFGGGLQSTLTNNGTFSKSLGAGATTINGIEFVNNGIVEALVGTINFSSNALTFNDGTEFVGPGAVTITGAATFAGGFTSENLALQSGTFTGDGAVLNGAVDYSGGIVTGDWTIAETAELTVLGPATKTLSAATISNEGTITWTGGAVSFQNATTLTNDGTIDAQTDNQFFFGGGLQSTLTNNGTFSKSLGDGTTTVQGIAFANNGVVEALVGTINFSSNALTFNDGTEFVGPGAVTINGNTTFAGGFTSENLVLASGTFTGNGAVLNGAVDYSGGIVTGGWTIDAAAELTVLGPATKTLSAADITNAGTITWTGGAISFQNATMLTNDGTIDVQTDNQLFFGGGAVGSFVNNGEIVKTAGAGTTTIGSNLGFDNEGVIDVQTGTIALPTNFANDGTLTGDGAFSLSSALTNNGVIDPGSGAGTLTLTGNYVQTLAGTLNIDLASSMMVDLFQISGTGALNGTLALNCLMGCAINDGDIFTILNTNGALSGVFGNVTASGFLAGFDFDVLYDYTADLVQLRINDAGMVVTPPPPPTGAIPEPSSWAMMILGFGLAGAMVRRRGNGRRVVA